MCSVFNVWDMLVVTACFHSLLLVTYGSTELSLRTKPRDSSPIKKVGLDNPDANTRDKRFVNAVAHSVDNVLNDSATLSNITTLDNLSSVNQSSTVSTIKFTTPRDSVSNASRTITHGVAVEMVTTPTSDGGTIDGTIPTTRTSTIDSNHLSSSPVSSDFTVTTETVAATTLASAWPFKTWESFGLIIGSAVGVMIIIVLVIVLVPRKRKTPPPTVQMDNVPESLTVNRTSALINPTFDMNTIEISRTLESGLPPVQAGDQVSLHRNPDGREGVLNFTNAMADYYRQEEARTQYGSAESEVYYESVDLFKRQGQVSAPNGQPSSAYDAPGGRGTETVASQRVKSNYNIPTSQITMPPSTVPSGVSRMEGYYNIDNFAYPPSPRLVNKLRDKYAHVPPFPPSPQLAVHRPPKPPRVDGKQSATPAIHIPTAASVNSSPGTIPRIGGDQPPFVADRTMVNQQRGRLVEPMATGDGNFLMAPRPGNQKLDTPRTVKKAYDELTNMLGDIPSDLWHD